jgi:hypothetical protein
VISLRTSGLFQDTFGKVPAAKFEAQLQVKTGIYSALLDMNSENMTSETTGTHNFHEIIFKLAVSCPFYLINYMF